MSDAADQAPTASAITPYTMVGGGPGLRRIVDRFYRVMDTDPEARDIRAMHPADLGPIREKLFEFLSGWLGGPPLYHRRTDRRCIVSAHSAFAIGAAERDQWLYCMRVALKELELPEEVRNYLDAPLFRLADFFRNR